MKVSYNPSRDWWSAPKNCTMTTNANIDDLDINGEGDLIFLSKGWVTVPKQIIFRKSSKGRGEGNGCLNNVKKAALLVWVV